MPIIRSAKKKLRADKKRQMFNNNLAHLLDSSLKKAKKTPSEKNIKETISIVDKSAKKNIIHKNKAARLKSKLSKFLTNKAGSIKKDKKTIASKKSPKKIVR